MISIRREEKFSHLSDAQLMAYELLMEYDIKSLPVDIVETLGFADDIVITDTHTYARLLQQDVNYVRDMIKESVVFRVNNRHYIFYNDTLSDDAVRWSLSCAIAYIKFQSSNTDKKENGYCDDFSSMNYAEDFSYNFVAPSPVLKECNAITASDIIKLCGIRFDKAHKKSKKLKSIYKNKNTKIEEIIKKQFKKFIHFHTPFTDIN